jgi:ATP-dependent DNA helicase RecG
LSQNPTSPFSELINSGESQTLEFKSSFDKACIESLVALANAHGGSVLVGVSDAGHQRLGS